MEGEFLGVGGRNSSAFVMKKSHGGRLDSAFSVSSAVHWPFLNRMQKFMAFETSVEDKRKKLLFEPLSSTGLQPAASVDAFEKSMSMERHGVTQLPMHASQTQSTENYPASTRRFNDDSFIANQHSSNPIAMSSPFLKSHGSSNGPNPTATTVKNQPFRSTIACNPSPVKNGVGSFTPRNTQKPHKKNAQLTIFYAGSVNVYDDVPSHMAEAIMLMASKECKTAKSEPGLTDDKTGGKSIVDLILTSENETDKTVKTSVGASTAATIMPRAVPQARKASLARFLERRKERVSNMMPYSCEKKSPDSRIVLDGAPPSSKCSSGDASISSNRCSSWYVSQAKSCSDSYESPSTKLEM